MDRNNDSREHEVLPGSETERSNPGDTYTTFPYDKCQIDYSSRQLICVHGKCVNQKICFKKYPDESISNFHVLYFHPEDKALMCEKAFPDILKFMQQVPPEEYPEYRLSFNHRYIREDGSSSQFLQEGALSVSDDEKNPLLKLRVFAEIDDFKTDETMVLSIFRHHANHGYKKIWTKVYNNSSNTAQLSHREIEIIKLCQKGLSSKMIANRLNLSIHTVKNHKRHCMEKTFTHSITELIHLCLNLHWL